MGFFCLLLFFFCCIFGCVFVGFFDITFTIFAERNTRYLVLCFFKIVTYITNETFFKNINLKTFMLFFIQLSTISKKFILRNWFLISKLHTKNLNLNDKYDYNQQNNSMNQLLVLRYVPSRYLAWVPIDHKILVLCYIVD